MQIVSKVLTTTIIIAGLIIFSSCETNRSTTKAGENIQLIKANIGAEGQSLLIELEAGKSHNHPTFAIWAEDMDENFIQTLFVTKSIGTGIFEHGPLESEKWDTKPGWQKRPAALPYWIHKRRPLNNGPQLPTPYHPVPDAYTGATPIGSANISSKLDQKMKGKIRILMEINQPWDWNQYWTNDLYDDLDYRTSCQPSVIYAVSIDLENVEKAYYLNPIGHGHYSGKNGKLYTDLSTITTAKYIFKTIKLELK